MSELIAKCAIKFGPHIVTGPFNEGHAGIIRRIAVDPEYAQDWKDARLSGLRNQGFITVSGRFVDRATARFMAIGSGQLTEDDIPDQHVVFSEDFVMATRRKASL